MEELLTAVSTSYRPVSHVAEDHWEEVPKAPQISSSGTAHVSSPEGALEALKGEPNYSTLSSTLKYLVQDATKSSGFRITQPSPVTAQLVNILVSEIIPNYWNVLNEEQESKKHKIFKNGRERKLLLSCLRSVTGLNAILARLKALIQQAKEGKKTTAGSKSVKQLQIYLEILEALLEGDGFVKYFWNDISKEPVSIQKALWHETVVLVGGSKILNIAAESVSIINESSSGIGRAIWIADGHLYSHWLTSNIITGAGPILSAPGTSWKPLPEIVNKALRLGYSESVIEGILKLILGSDKDRSGFVNILECLGSYEQQTFLNGGLRLLSKKYFHSSVTVDGKDWWKDDSGIVAAAAGYVKSIIATDETRLLHLITWLTSSTGAGVGDPVGIRRAAVAALSDSKFSLESVFERSLQQFGDQLYIRYTPSIQQEVHSQVLLLAAGSVYRTSPMKLTKITRSSSYLSAVSNRLAASSERARFLGMIVGEALSSFSDNDNNKMDFKMEELQSTEALWYKSLINVSDTIGSIQALQAGPLSMRNMRTKDANASSLSKKTVQLTQSKITSIEEIIDEDEEAEEDDIIPYAKPDSDTEDSDEDPTLVQRNKPTAPVYIRDLIVFLRDIESYDRQKLGLSTASSLIRRKANFGTEVSDHVEELARLLVGIQDKFDMDNFQDMRLQGMIAVLLSQPSKMGPWFARTFFEGDYSVAQRASVLSVLGVSARELGGFKEQDAPLTTIKSSPPNAFPSKVLPARLHKFYSAEQPDAIDALSQHLYSTMIQPLAASLADKATGPDILKVRTFSSRLAVEAKRKPPTINALSAIVANNFFFPLTARFAAHLKAYGAKNVIFEPFLLSSYLKTLSLILHAGGTSTLQLPQMTSEFWDLLLSLRTTGQLDNSVGEALMFGFLTLLEMNADQRRMAELHGRELLETQKWVEGLFQRLRGGSKEDDKLRSLAAGVLLKIREIIEKYQALLVGDMSSF